MIFLILFIHILYCIWFLLSSCSAAELILMYNFLRKASLLKRLKKKIKTGSSSHETPQYHKSFSVLLHLKNFLYFSQLCEKFPLHFTPDIQYIISCPSSCTSKPFAYGWCLSISGVYIWGHPIFSSSLLHILLNGLLPTFVTLAIGVAYFEFYADELLLKLPRFYSWRVREDMDWKPKRSIEQIVHECNCNFLILLWWRCKNK